MVDNELLVGLTKLLLMSGALALESPTSDFKAALGDGGVGDEEFGKEFEDLDDDDIDE